MFGRPRADDYRERHDDDKKEAADGHYQSRVIFVGLFFGLFEHEGLHLSLCADGHSSDEDGGSRDASPELDIIPYHLDGIEHLFEISRSRHSLHWKCELAIFNPCSRSASGVIAVDDVYAEPDQLRHVKPALD